MISFYHFLLFISHQSQEFCLRIAVRASWNRGSSWNVGEGKAEEVQERSWGAALWQHHWAAKLGAAGKTSELLRLGAKLNGIGSLPLMVLSFSLFSHFNVVLLNLAHFSVFPPSSETQSLVRTRGLLLSVVALASSWSRDQGLWSSKPILKSPTVKMFCLDRLLRGGSEAEWKTIPANAVLNCSWK